MHRLLRTFGPPCLAGLLATAACALPARAADAGPPSSYGDRLLAAVNDYRGSRGLQPLRPAAALQRIAAPHSQSMARSRQISHTGFKGRFELADSDLCVENIAAGAFEPQEMLAAWRDSPAHDRNLLEPRVRWVGIATVQGYTTLFACESEGPRP